jgi:hypothetical protein
VRPELHGYGLASAGFPGTRLGASHTEHTSQGPTSDALVTGRLPRLSPDPPSDQRRFRLRLVKGSGFRDTGRLQPASNPSRALRFSPRARHPAIALDVFSPSAPGFGLGPRQPRRPQPPWPIWIWRRLLTYATNTEAGHTERTTVPHPKRAFLTLRCLGAEATETVSGALYRARRLRTDTKGIGHAGRGHPSQHARGGTEANSGLPGHPTVAGSSSSKSGTSEAD